MWKKKSQGMNTFASYFLSSNPGERQSCCFYSPWWCAPAAQFSPSVESCELESLLRLQPPGGGSAARAGSGADEAREREREKKRVNNDERGKTEENANSINDNQLISTTASQGPFAGICSEHRRKWTHGSSLEQRIINRIISSWCAVTHLLIQEPQL